MTAKAMTAHSRRNASNRRNESNNRTANTVGTPAKAGMLVNIVKQQQLTTRILATAAETIGTTQTSTAEGRPATAEMQEIIEMSTTILTSAGTPTAKYELMSFRGNSRKSRQSGEKLVKKSQKRVEISHS
jgi:hypothetical protein